MSKHQDSGIRRAQDIGGGTAAPVVSSHAVGMSAASTDATAGITAETRRGLLFARAFYTLYYGANAFLMPFMALYYSSLGFTGSEIGLLSGIAPLITLVSAPLWGAAADATRRHKAVWILAIVGSWVTVLALSMTSAYAALIAVVVARAFFSAPVAPLADSAVIELLGERREQYGGERLWGAVGWGVCAFIAGIVVDHYGLPWAFGGHLALTAVGIVAVAGIPVAGMARDGLRRRAFGDDLRVLLSNRSWLLFLIVMLVGGFFTSFDVNYLFLYLQDLKASETMMGVAVVIATISEIPTWALGPWLLKRWGARGLLTFALVAALVQACMYAFLPPGALWIALVAQLLHGPAFGAMLLAGVTYAAEVAPKGTQATAQGLFTGIKMGLGSALGAFIGGHLYEAVGGAAMFRWSILTTLLALGLLSIGVRRQARA